MTEPPSLLLTTAEAAALLRVSEETLRRWAQQGVMRSVKVGAQWRFRRADIEAIFAEPSAVTA